LRPCIPAPLPPCTLPSFPHVSGSYAVPDLPLYPSTISPTSKQKAPNKHDLKA